MKGRRGTTNSIMMALSYISSFEGRMRDHCGDYKEMRDNRFKQYLCMMCLLVLGNANM